MGYDIQSFDENGNEIFIEVKTTTRNFENDIYFTQRELDVMEKLGSSYFLYRVYNLDIDNERGEISIFKGRDKVKQAFLFRSEVVKGKLKLL